MKLIFIGADHEVTGSCHVISACGKTILIDCGMEQGVDIFENQEIPVSPGEIDYVLLTHAHIDHSGKLPLLVKNGFKGEIITSEATKDLCDIMLRDSAHIQEFEAEWRNRKAKRSGKEEYVPLYVMSDAEDAIKLLKGVEYNKKIDLVPGIQVRFVDIGHLLGSAAIEMWITEDGITKKIVFSGDVGNTNQPIIKDPTPVEEADYVVVESTYGDRVHSTERPDYVADFTKILNDTFSRGGNVVVPSFAVGRTQELLYFLREIKNKNLVPNYPDFEVYVDSPLANGATTVFNKNIAGYFDEEAMSLINKGINPLTFSGLKTSITSEESIQINNDFKPKVILSASGMCEAGRIRHHLKHNLWRRDSTVCFVGYQAEGTLGRKILDGATEVKIFGETIQVNCQVVALKGISGHADKIGLLNWLQGFKKKPEKIFVVHGENHVTDTFAELIKSEIGVDAIAPYSGGSVDLATGEVISLGIPIPIEHKKKTYFNTDNSKLSDKDSIAEERRQHEEFLFEKKSKKGKNTKYSHKDEIKFNEGWTKAQKRAYNRVLDETYELLDLLKKKMQDPEADFNRYQSQLNNLINKLK
ncbi:MAG: MBL fold metallo-hydrolase [Lachnospiraceae bacterium]|jgi:metallo-beta-lactamase family protein|nr:MBL fold metallo-hydrolase [Lachnospiraceae bacterium]